MHTLMLVMALTAVSEVQVGELTAAPLIAADAMQPSATRLHDRGGTKRSLINPKTTLADVGRVVTLTGATVALLVPVTAVMWSFVVNMNPLVLILGHLGGGNPYVDQFNSVWFSPISAIVGLTGISVALVGALLWGSGAIYNAVTRNKQREQFESAMKTLDEKNMLQTPSSRLALPIESTMASYTFSF